MRFGPQGGFFSDGKQAGTRRRFGRLPQEVLTSNIGVVLDLSAGGMRVLARRLPAQRVAITLRGYSLPGPLIAEAQWSRRIGMFRHEIGLRFPDPPANVTQVLTQIAATHRLRRVM